MIRALRLARAALSAPGFGTAAALGLALLVAGLGQSVSLLVRADPYRGHAALLALFLLAGSALLFWFIEQRSSFDKASSIPWRLAQETHVLKFR